MLSKLRCANYPQALEDQAVGSWEHLKYFRCVLREAITTFFPAARIPVWKRDITENIQHNCCVTVSKMCPPHPSGPRVAEQWLITIEWVTEPLLCFSERRRRRPLPDHSIWLTYKNCRKVIRGMRHFLKEPSIVAQCGGADLSKCETVQFCT